MDLRKSLTGKKIAVLKGGASAERSVSLKSGEMCAAALRQLGLTVVEIDVQNDVVQQLHMLEPDICFNALHGKWGEDGCVQGLLELLKIPYTHSGVLASAVAMNKQMAKQLYVQAGLQTPFGKVLTVAEIAKKKFIDKPYVVKPVNEGSSVGIYIVKENSSADIPELVPEFSWMIEEYIPGRELTVSILNDAVLGVTEIVPQTSSEWYDFEAKYAEAGSKHIVPAKLPDDITQEIKEMALKAHRALGCHSISRSDFRYNQDRGLFILETNTQPGMTPTSLLPEQAAAQGMSFADLCFEILKTAQLHI